LQLVIIMMVAVHTGCVNAACGEPSLMPADVQTYQLSVTCILVILRTSYV
jgi:hypothetical protein